MEDRTAKHRAAHRSSASIRGITARTGCLLGRVDGLAVSVRRNGHTDRPRRVRLCGVCLSVCAMGATEGPSQTDKYCGKWRRGRGGGGRPSSGKVYVGMASIGGCSSPQGFSSALGWPSEELARSATSTCYPADTLKNMRALLSVGHKASDSCC
jgi:hypothetical protein